MYTTIELKRYIINQIENKIGSVDWRKINFAEGNENSAEGTYIFSRDNVYHILFTEKGKVREDKITTDEKEVIRSVLDIVSFDIAMEFAISNQRKIKTLDVNCLKKKWKYILCLVRLLKKVKKEK